MGGRSALSDFGGTLSRTALPGLHVWQNRPTLPLFAPLFVAQGVDGQNQSGWQRKAQDPPECSVPLRYNRSALVRGRAVECARCLVTKAMSKRERVFLAQHDLGPYSVTRPWKILYIDRWPSQPPAASARQIRARRPQLVPVRRCIRGQVAFWAILCWDVLAGPGRSDVAIKQARQHSTDTPIANSRAVHWHQARHAE